jgi:hypothetical protein
MNRRTFLSTGTASFLSPWFASGAAAEENAAPYYRKACQLLPAAPDPVNSTQKHEAEDQLLESLPAAPVNALGLDLIRRSEPALQEMIRGAALKHCDWGADFFTKEFDSLMPFMMKLRRLARVSCLRASYSFQKKNSPAALDDLAASIKMGRHFGRRGPFIARLVQIAIENSALDVAAAYLPQQKGKNLKALAGRFDSLRKTGPLSEAMQEEKAFLLQYSRPKYEGKNWKEVLALLRKEQEIGAMLGKGQESEDEFKAIVKASGGNVKGVLRLLDGASVLYDELARIWDLPPGEFEAAVSAFRRKHASDNPFATSILQWYEGIRFASDRTKARFAMLDAATKVVAGGPAQLKAVRDPFGNGPFEYHPFKGGFELKSKLRGQDQVPVSLLVGVKAKD